MSQDIRDLTFSELSLYLKNIGERSFRAKQIAEWLYKKCAQSFDAMSDLPETLRQRLKADFLFHVPDSLKQHVSSDGTEKIVFRLRDDHLVETAVIPVEDRCTVCVSTQVGCKFGCLFCASGIGGWQRDLSVAEIIGQVCHARHIHPERPVTHVVFMGIGEPFDNYDHVMQAARTMNAKEGLGIAARHITISTCGVVPGIERFANEAIQIELAISLHAPNDKLRRQIMPVARKYPLDVLIAACRKYCEITNRQITFEYVLIKDLTCTPEAARELGTLLKGLICKINLIPCNPVPELGYKAPSDQDVKAFRGYLTERGIHHTLRKERGSDIAAACGQLRRLG